MSYKSFFSWIYAEITCVIGPYGVLKGTLVCSTIVEIFFPPDRISPLLVLRLELGIENLFQFQKRILKVSDRILVVKLKFRFHGKSWPNGQRVGLVIKRLRVRVSGQQGL